MNNALLAMIGSGGNFNPVGGYAQGVQLRNQMEGNALQKQMQMMQMQTLVGDAQARQQQAGQLADTQAGLGAMFGPGYGGMDPSIAVQAYKAQNPSPMVSVTNESALRTGEQEARVTDLKAMMKAEFDTQQRAIAAGDAAQLMLPLYKLGLDVLTRGDTGPGTQAWNTFQKVAGKLGMDVDWDRIADLETLAPVFGEFLFAAMQNTKGPISDAETRIFTAMSPNYANSTEGNRRMVEYAMRRAERDIGIQQMIKRERRKGTPSNRIGEMVDAMVERSNLSAILVRQVVEDEGRKYGVMPDGEFIDLGPAN